MSEIEEVLKRNQKAVDELQTAKDMLATLNELREAGIARGDSLRPFGRQFVVGLKGRGQVRANLKLTFRA